MREHRPGMWIGLVEHTIERGEKAAGYDDASDG